MDKIKRLYEKYRIEIDEKFKEDLLEAFVFAYGEECREDFKKKMDNIEIHTKIRIEKLIEYVRENKSEEDFSLEEEIIAEYEKEKAVLEKEADTKIIKRQYQLIDEIKQRLSKEDAQKLQDEVDELTAKGSAISFDSLDLSMREMFESKDYSMLKKVIEQYKLDFLSKGKEEREDFVKKYFEDEKEISGMTKRKLDEKYSSYAIVKEECEKYDVTMDLLEEFRIAGAAVTTFAKKDNINKTKDQVFIEPFDKKSKILAKIAHESLHTAERDIIIDEENQKIDTSTGFDNKIDGVNTTLFSEVIHIKILDEIIYPYLRGLGYEIIDANDYRTKSLNTNGEFFEMFKTAILAARRGDIGILLDVVGRENFIRYAELQNNYNDENSSIEAEKILEKMKEYARESVGTRIGKATLPEQEDIRGKEIIGREIMDLTKDSKGIEIDE